jgi:Domain of unknown function (DUF4398)
MRSSFDGSSAIRAIPEHLEDDMTRLLYAAALALMLALPAAAQAADRKDADLALIQARTSLQSAEAADAARYASADLKNARDGLASADGQYERRNWTSSLMDAEKATADANLAAARARQQRAESTTAEVEASVRSLREQLGMKGG